MIVSCPACHTRYRHVAAEHSRVRCTHCSEEFPLVADRQGYLVLQSPSTAPVGSPRMHFGMDERGGGALTHRALAGSVETAEVAGAAGTPRFRGAWRMILKHVGPPGLTFAAALAAHELALRVPDSFHVALFQKADAIIWAVAGGCLGLVASVFLIRWTAPTN